MDECIDSSDSDSTLVNTQESNSSDTEVEQDHSPVRSEVCSRIPETHPYRDIKPKKSDSENVEDISRRIRHTGTKTKDFRVIVGQTHQRLHAGSSRTDKNAPSPSVNEQSHSAPALPGPLTSELPRANMSAAEEKLPFNMMTNNTIKCEQPINSTKRSQLLDGITFSWEKLEAGANGHVEPWSIDLAAKNLVMNDTLSMQPLLGPSEETEKLMKELQCRSLEQNDAEDFRDKGFIFVRGHHKVVKRVNVTDLGPSVNNLIKPDRVLKRDVYGQKKNLKSALFPEWLKQIDPITAFRRLFLDGQVTSLISRSSNRRLQVMTASKKWQILDNCERITPRDVENFLLMSYLMVGCYYNLMDDRSRPLDNFYYSHLMSRYRMLQIAHCFKMKSEGQTSDQYFFYLNRYINTRLKLLHRRLPKVLAVQTYCIGFDKDSQTAERRPTRPIHVSVLRAGYVLFRMQFHYQPGDTQISGFRPSPSVEVLQRLFEGIDLNKRYVTMAGESTIDTAEFFLKQKARFIGSTGPLPATARHLETVGVEKGVIGPGFPFSTFHFEPAPGLRECLLMKRYQVYVRSRAENVFLKIPRNIISESHIYCTIGGGTVVPIKLVEHDSKLHDTFAPLNCFLMTRINTVNRLYERNYECFMRFGNCCMNWHQNVLFHALFSCFITCWMSHAAARGVIVSHHHATRYILKQLVEVSRSRLLERRRHVNNHCLVHELRMMRHILCNSLRAVRQKETENQQQPAVEASATAQAVSQKDTGTVKGKEKRRSKLRKKDDDEKSNETRSSSGRKNKNCSGGNTAGTSSNNTAEAPTSEAISSSKDEDSKALTLKFQKEFSRTFLIKSEDGCIEKITDENKHKLEDPSAPNIADLVSLEPEMAEKAIRNVYSMEHRISAVGADAKFDWIRKGYPAPDFKDFGKVDPDSSDHDSDEETPIDDDVSRDMKM